MSLMQSSERPPGTRSARDGHPETRRGTACERRHRSRGIRRETNGYQESVSQSPPLRLPVRQVFMRCSSGHIWLPGTLLSALQGTWSFLNWAAKSGGRVVPRPLLPRYPHVRRPPAAACPITCKSLRRGPRTRRAGRAGAV